MHLASVVSGGAERDFDAALEVNIDGGRALVQACRAHGTAPRLVFTSSLAVFGGELALGPVDDDTRADAVDDLRRDQGDARAALRRRDAQGLPRRALGAAADRDRASRARPTPPPRASPAPSCASRSRGAASTLPVSLDLPTVVIGVDTTVGCLAQLLEVDGDALGSGRTRQPARPRHHVRRAARGRCTRLVDPADARAARGRGRPGRRERWCAAGRSTWSSARADALGLPRDEDAAGIVRAYLRASGGERRAEPPCSPPASGRRAPSASIPFGPRSRSSRSPARSSRSSSSGTARRCASRSSAIPSTARCCAPSTLRSSRGYHLDKRHWITITLDGSLPQTMIEELIEDSYDLVARAQAVRPRRDRRRLAMRRGQRNQAREQRTAADRAEQRVHRVLGVRHQAADVAGLVRHAGDVGVGAVRVLGVAQRDLPGGRRCARSSRAARTRRRRGA